MLPSASNNGDLYLEPLDQIRELRDINTATQTKLSDMQSQFEQALAEIASLRFQVTDMSMAIS